MLGNILAPCINYTGTVDGKYIYAPDRFNKMY